MLNDLSELLLTTVCRACACFMIALLEMLRKRNKRGII